jgi:CSLREA domain-containing protein
MSKLIRVLSVAIVALGSLAVAAPARAATIVVNTFVDELNSDGDCSLREAIRSANSDGVDPHDDCAAGSGADTITLPAGTYALSVVPAGDDTAEAGDLDITTSSAVTIDPTGTVVIDATALNDRAFHVLAGATLTIADLTIQRGSAPAGENGGAILNEGTLALAGASLIENRAQDGGAISTAGTATLANDTLSANRATASGGGVHIGGGTADLNNVTIAGNEADSDSNVTGNGGGVAVAAGAIELSNTTIGDNRDLSAGAANRHPDCSGTVTSQSHNLIEGVAGCTIIGNQAGNITGKDPRLFPLAAAGGPTPTHALRKRSPAIDAGSPAAPGSGGSACEATDQRGVPRPQGPRCDIGAFEVEVAGAGGPMCLGRPVTIAGTPGNDTLVGTAGPDSIQAKAGNDSISGLARADTICAGRGRDVARGGPGPDRMVGGADADRLNGGPGRDSISGGGGKDTLRGGRGRDVLRGGRGRDVLRGGRGRDVLIGGPGFDVCRGGPGRDRFIGCERRIQ